MVHSLTKQVISCVSAKDTVITVGIDQLPEIFVCLHQCLHIFSRRIQSCFPEESAYSVRYKWNRRSASMLVER